MSSLILQGSKDLRILIFFYFQANVVRKNYMFKTFDQWGPDFDIKFDMKVLRNPQTEWVNIMHFTTRSDCKDSAPRSNCGKGTRVPGLWLHYNKYEGLELFCSVSMKKNEHNKYQVWPPTLFLLLFAFSRINDPSLEQLLFSFGLSSNSASVTGP